MNCKIIVTLSFVANAFLGTAAFAGSHEGHSMNDHHAHMMEMMRNMHSQMHATDHRDMRGPMQNKDHHSMKGMMGGMTQKMLDADDDGTVTPEEANTQLQSMLKQYDADASGTLSIEEYEALHSAMIREMMVDRFQHLDADGDGQITSEEISAPADHAKRMKKMRMQMGTSDTNSDSSMEDMDHGGSTQEH